MATTTNYGWTTPNDTDLVKDGAAAIRTLGSSVDTTTKALNPSTTLGDIEYRSATANTNTRLGIGSTGQVLTVAGGVPTWATSDDANAIQNAIVDAKGDIVAASAADTPARLAVGTDNQRLVAASGEATGLKYVSDTQNTVIDAAGDLVYGTAADTLARLAIGTAGQVLTVNSGATAPEWKTAASGSTYSGVSLYKSAAQTVSNSTFTAITWDSERYDTDSYHSTSTNTSRITIPSGKSGYYILTGSNVWDANATGNRGLELRKNGTSLYYLFFQDGFASNDGTYPFTGTINLTAGDYIEVFCWQSSGGNLNLNGGAGGATVWQLSYLGA